jgi:4-amino-4-deoxy-L-arabinose transferase-like glycosyltransferase
MNNRAFDDWVNNIEKRPALAVIFASLWVFVVGWIAFLWNLGSVGLVDETEPLFAEASRQMLVTGDWITPYFNGETRFDKPALIYWCQAIAYKIIGVNESAVRLPSALAAIAVMGLAFYTVSWHLKKQDNLENFFRPTRRWLTSALAAGLIGLNPEMIVWGRTGVSDMLLTGCIASSLLCFFMAYAQPEKAKIQTKWYVASYILMGAGILTKGPVGIVLPGLIILAFVFYLGNWREVLREMRPILGTFIVLAISVPWYVLVTLRNGEAFINSFFGYHNFERFTEVVNNHSAPWYFYFLVVLALFAPYSIYLPAAMASLKFWQRNYWRSQQRWQQLGLFAFVWFTAIFTFFTISVTKLPSYVLPLMPAAAILVALFFHNVATKKSSPSHSSSIPTSHSPLLYWTGWANVMFFSALAVTLYYLPKLLGPDEASPNFAAKLEQSNLTEAGGVIFLIGAVIIALLLLRRRLHLVIDINLLTLVALIVVTFMPTYLLMDQERQLPLRELSAIAREQRKQGEELIMVGFKKPSVTFYTQSVVNYQRSAETAKPYIQKQVDKKVQPSSVLVLSPPTEIKQLSLQRPKYENLGIKGAYQLVRLPLKN